MQRAEVEALIRRHLKKYATRDEVMSVGPFVSDRAIASDDGGNLTEVSVTREELGHLDNVSSNIQTQFINKLDASVVNAYSQGLLSKNSEALAKSYMNIPTAAFGTAAHSATTDFLQSNSGTAIEHYTGRMFQINSDTDWDHGHGALIVSTDNNASQMCISGRQIFQRVGNNDDDDVKMNYNGKDGGHTRFRDFNMYDGKGSLIAQIDGSAGMMRATEYGSFSDDRIKHNETVVTDALGIIKKLTVKKYLKSRRMYAADYTLGVNADGTFTGLQEGDSVQPDLGVIAQDVEGIPEIAWTVDSEEDQPKSVNYNALFALNIQATQELATLVESQAATIAALEARVAVLEAF